MRANPRGTPRAEGVFPPGVPPLEALVAATAAQDAPLPGSEI